MLAEQIAIHCAPAVAEDLFSQRRPAWLVPLLRLAGDEGEAAGLGLLGGRAGADRRQAPRRRGHEVQLRLTEPGRECFRVGMLWRTSDYRALFAHFEGTVEVRPFDDHAVVSIQGYFAEPAPAPAPSPAVAASRRAAEAAVRSLLGHVRTAIEERAHLAGGAAAVVQVHHRS